VDDQITVRLPTTLGRTLRRTSRRLGRRPSDVVRMALEAFLQGAPSTATTPAERVEYLIGSLSSGVPDLPERHREYLNVALQPRRVVVSSSRRRLQTEVSSAATAESECTIVQKTSTAVQ
jgi:Arc/MetJ-type ribon-helix-helix transcriptional regulator